MVLIYVQAIAYRRSCSGPLISLILRKCLKIEKIFRLCPSVLRVGALLKSSATMKYTPFVSLFSNDFISCNKCYRVTKEARQNLVYTIHHYVQYISSNVLCIFYLEFFLLSNRCHCLKSFSQKIVFV